VIARPPLAVPLLALAGFVVLLGLVVTGWPPLARADATISDAFRDYGVPRQDLIAVLRVVTDAAATLPYVSVGLAGFLLLRHAGDRRGAALCATVTAVVPGLWLLLHLLLHRPRPRDGFVTVDSNGFPSGHTTMATAAALMIVLVLWPRLARGPRAVAVVLAAGFAIFIGVTRVALRWLAAGPGGGAVGRARGRAARAAVCRADPRVRHGRAAAVTARVARAAGRGWRPAPCCAVRAWRGSG
jgi:undecaprenyl-diphosphatase